MDNVRRHAAISAVRSSAPLASLPCFGSASHNLTRLLMGFMDTHAVTLDQRSPSPMVHISFPSRHASSARRRMLGRSQGRCRTSRSRRSAAVQTARPRHNRNWISPADKHRRLDADPCCSDHTYSGEHAERRHTDALPRDRQLARICCCVAIVWNICMAHIIMSCEKCRAWAEVDGARGGSSLAGTSSPSWNWIVQIAFDPE